MSNKQRVSKKDAETLLDKIVKDFKGMALTFEYDGSGGSECYYNEAIVKQLIDKLTR